MLFSRVKISNPDTGDPDSGDVVHSHSYVCVWNLSILPCPVSQSSLSPHLESPSLVSPSEHATREQCLPGEHPPVPFQFQRGCSGTQHCQMCASAKET